MNNLLTITDDQFEAEVLKNDQITVVEFGATWCGPCKKLHPVMAELAQEMSDKVKIVEIDVGESPQTAQQYAVVSVPQVLMFHNGDIIDRVIGVLSKAKLKEKIESHL